MLGVGLGLISQRRRAAAGAPDLTAGLLAFWRLDGNGQDSSGNGRNLTMGGATYGPGVIGQCLSAGHGDLNSLIVSGDYTLSVWIYTTTTTGDAGVYAGGVRTNDGLIFVAARDPGEVGPPQLYVLDGTLTVNDLDGEVWTHAVVRRVGAVVEVYVNGQLVGSGTGYDVSGSFRIMADGDFETPVDLVGIWGRALSPAEILTLYAAGAGFDPTA